MTSAVIDSAIIAKGMDQVNGEFFSSIEWRNDNVLKTLTNDGVDGSKPLTESGITESRRLVCFRWTSSDLRFE